MSVSPLPDIQISEAEELDLLKTGTRTPRPYFHESGELQHHRNDAGHEDFHDARGGGLRRRGRETRAERNGWSGQGSTAGSESGTEADDERSSFIKALPAPHLRPRKGLKTGEEDEETLLTPSQLDAEETRLAQDYFQRKPRDKITSQDEDQAEQEKLLKRRWAEFARRSSEVGLMAVVVGSVLCGKGVWQAAGHWRRELLVHVTIIIALILAYPLKLSIVDTRSQATKFLHRFRVPASFDPATVLYPPLLPVLVALSVSPANSATIMPNIILGLSSLPQRLFPRSSRLGGINVLHWFISIIPLIVAENTAFPSEERPAMPYMLKSGNAGLRPETLVSLYPLHHELLQPLQNLTTTSLLISELHLLSAALINLLLLATSPQTVILKACLWIGGVSLFVLCAPVLHWNVTLMRVPRWKLRRAGHTAEERKSLVDAVSDLINIQRGIAGFKSSETEGSDADEDVPDISIKQRANGRPKLSLSNLTFSTIDDSTEPVPKSAVEPRYNTNGALPELTATQKRPRRNTLPVREAPDLPLKQQSNQRKGNTSNLPWCLYLTAAQAQRRKWLYAGYVYIAIAIIVLLPVRYYVFARALDGQEPVGWALGYLVGQLAPVRSFVNSLGLQTWIPLPAKSNSLRDVQLTFPLDIPAFRLAWGLANVRLFLIGYWGLVLIAGLLAVFSLTALVEVDTRRKVFHGVMVAMLLPATFIDPCACALALALILAVFLLLEVIRAGQVPPLGNAIGRFVAPYVDGRDLRGPVVVSHVFLLIGCAVPLWFSLASINRAGETPWKDWELIGEQREVAMVAGVICVGMGDAAASLIGRRYGRHKWAWVGGKSLEGSAAFAVAVTAGLMAGKAWLVVGGWSDTCASSSLSGHGGYDGGVLFAQAWLVTLLKAVLCACGASFMEAVLTGANDNVVVPVALWLLVKGVGL